jgi:hypothetical protein
MIDIALWSRMRLFLTGVQDSTTSRSVATSMNPESPGIFPDPDLTNPRTYRFHRFPIVGIVADLDLVKLVTRFRSGIVPESCGAGRDRHLGKRLASRSA